jgi:hypothetical protein
MSRCSKTWVREGPNIIRDACNQNQTSLPWLIYFNSQKTSIIIFYIFYGNLTFRVKVKLNLLKSFEIHQVQFLFSLMGSIRNAKSISQVHFGLQLSVIVGRNITKVGLKWVRSDSFYVLWEFDKSFSNSVRHIIMWHADPVLHKSDKLCEDCKKKVTGLFDSKDCCGKFSGYKFLDFYLRWLFDL